MNPFDAAPLRGLDEASRRRIEAAGQQRSPTAGTFLFREGDDADALFVVLRGQVEVLTEQGVLRVAEPGHTLGEESLLGMPRRASARAVQDAEVFEVGAALLQRAWARAGGRPAAAAERRRVERAVVADLLRSVFVGLDGWAFELLLDGASLRTIDADSFLARAGDPAAAAAVLLDGVVHVREACTRTVERVLLPGDALALAEANEGRPWSHDAVAAGPCRVVWLRPDALRAALGSGVHARVGRASARTAQTSRRLEGLQCGPGPAPVDVFRLSRARALLAIDQDACVRCGECTRACTRTHADGLARMRRAGPRLSARQGSANAPMATWLLAESCQHCSNPACLPDCPTGAIVRGGDGVVQIDPGLCTGCGACAKACPWDAIELAPRPARTAQPPGGPFDAVAIKCDLCTGRSAGPACADVCPTQALVRLDPGRDLVEVAAVLDRPPPTQTRPPSPWPWIASLGIGAGLALGSWGASRHAYGWIPGTGPGLWSGWIAAAAMLFAVAYAAMRRLRVSMGRGPAAMSMHAVVGAWALGAALAHSGGAGIGTPGVLLATLAGSVGLGLFGWVAYRVLPRRLTRLEAEVEDERIAVADRVDVLMRAVGGRSDALKRLTATILMPYARSFGGGLRLLVSGRSLAQERQRLRASLESSLGGPRLAKMDGLDDVLVAVVEARASRPRHVLRFALRGWLLPHIVLSMVGVALLVVHVCVRGAG